MGHCGLRDDATLARRRRYGNYAILQYTIFFVDWQVCDLEKPLGFTSLATGQRDCVHPHSTAGHLQPSGRPAWTQMNNVNGTSLTTTLDLFFLS